MSCSPARLLANQANASRSTGPTTQAGKEVSRRNALKHGLTGAGVVIPGEDEDEAATRVEALQAELAPRGGMMTRILIQKVALMSIRTERCARQEAATIAERVRTAAADFDEARRSKVDALFDALGQNPATHHRQLLLSPEGIDLLLGALRGLRADVAERWTEAHAIRFDECTGHRRGPLMVSRCQALTDAVGGDFDRIEPDEYAQIDPADREDWPIDQLGMLIDTEIDRLDAHRATLDLDDLATSRAQAGERALFDSGHDATLARKYEANAERVMFKALKELREVRADTASDRPSAANPPGGRWGPSLGSFLPAPGAGQFPADFGPGLTYKATDPWRNPPRSDFDPLQDRLNPPLSSPRSE